MKILIETIPHKSQRYPTCGDWQVGPEGIKILVSTLGNKDLEFLVAVHELVEVYLCQKHGVTDQQVTEFDEKFEAHRGADNTSEPGDAADSPYRQEHFVATSVERILARELNVDWAEYERVLGELS